MSLIKRSYKYRMYPNKTQEELLAKNIRMRTCCMECLC